jgi:phosphoglycolate phosphatase-like HAD superfamily hydrolase
MNKLLLFDIDGTLIHSNRVGTKAMIRVLEEFLGNDEALLKVKMGGKCDWGIWRELLGTEDYSDEEVDAHLPELWRAYTAALADILGSDQHADPEVLPGVRPLLDALQARDDMLLGLLTGNIEAGAWLKLGKVGLDHYFRFGAFGHQAANRSALPPIAVEQALLFANGKRFTGKEIVIIGDTVHDIRCGEALGVCAIGVATGSVDAQTLREAGADYVFESFADYEAVLPTLAI